MSSIAASPNPCLVAILLITQARAGDTAQVTFHYPPDPFKHDEAKAQLDDAALDESSSDSGSDSSSDDNPFEPLSPQAKFNGKKLPANAKNLFYPDESHSVKVDQSGYDGEWKPPWDPLLGLGEENLVSLLAPGRTWHKRKFEMGINDLTFIGRPVYARENGTWARRRRKKTKQEPQAESKPVSDHTSDSDLTEGDNKTATSPRRSTKEDTPRKSLTMFHLVFVLNPPPLEQFLRVREMYDHVAKRLSKILKLEQAKSNYVWEQSELIQRVRGSHLMSSASADTYYSHITKQSTLANAISLTYRTISQSRVAAVALSPKISISMQIPPVTSTPYLPSLTEPPIKPGLWLTTANDNLATNSDLDEATASSTSQLAKNFTLLLQESSQKILKELQQADEALVLAFTTFLEKLRSTQSFYKLSVASKISLADIQLLARHLIYWRRAVAIPPLHHRDAYIVSPNADMSQLVRASKIFEASFPMLPSLPKILNLMSQTPKPYRMLIPSSDHKEEYYRVLAWLMRGGWVTQLRTFAYVRIDPRVKRAVREKDKEAQNQARIEKLDLHKEHVTNGAQTSPIRRPSIASRPSSDGRHSNSSNKPSHNPNSASLIMSPLRASGEESKWLAHIADSLLLAENHRPGEEGRLSPDQKQELRAYWNIFVKYFNGAEALEKIPMREGLKRKFVWDLLSRMGLNFDRGVLDAKGENESVMVTVRHW